MLLTYLSKNSSRVSKWVKEIQLTCNAELLLVYLASQGWYSLSTSFFSISVISFQPLLVIVFSRTSFYVVSNILLVKKIWNSCFSILLLIFGSLKHKILKTKTKICTSSSFYYDLGELIFIAKEYFLIRPVANIFV